MDKVVRSTTKRLLGVSMSVLVSLSTGSAYAQSMSDMKEYFTPEQIKYLNKLVPQKETTDKDIENTSTYSRCSEEIDHVKLYDYGKTLASGWIFWLKQNAKEEKQYPSRTKSSFMTASDIGYTGKYKITKDNEYSQIYYCRMGYRTTAASSSWSSVHQGLVDYLPNPYKAKFLSLPER
jgi:hypothetical protein